MKNQNGFTLIEIAIAITIISILAAVAIPAYNKYVLKSKFAEVINMTSAISQSVALCVKEYKQTIGCSGGINSVIQDITANNKTKYTLNVITQDGVITATARGPDDSIAIAAAGGASGMPSSCYGAGWGNTYCAKPTGFNASAQPICPAAYPGLTAGSGHGNGPWLPMWGDYYAGKNLSIILMVYATPYTCAYIGTPAPALKPTGLHNETYILTPSINADVFKWTVSGTCLTSNLCN